MIFGHSGLHLELVFNFFPELNAHSRLTASNFGIHKMSGFVIGRIVHAEHSVISAIRLVENPAFKTDFAPTGAMNVTRDTGLRGGTPAYIKTIPQFPEKEQSSHESIEAQSSRYSSLMS